MNPIDQLIDQYRRGYKTTELWVAMAAGLAQALSAGFVPGSPVSKQLTNLTWVGIAYILARSGLKVAHVTAQARVSSPASRRNAMTAVAASPDPAVAPGIGVQHPPLDLRFDVVWFGGHGRGEEMRDDVFRRLCAGQSERGRGHFIVMPTMGLRKRIE